MRHTVKICGAFLLLLITSFVGAQSKISIEAISPDVTLTVRGPEKEIDKIDPANLKQLKEGIFLLTPEFGKQTGLKNKNYTLVQIDDKLTVTKLVNVAGANKTKPKFNEVADIAIPKNGFVLVAIDGDYSKGFRKFLAENFRQGDVVKLRKEGNICSLNDVMLLNKEQINLAFERILTVTHSDLKIAGKIANYSPSKKYSIIIAGKAKQVTSGDFSFPYTLEAGVNYIDVELWEGSKKLNDQTIIAFLKLNTTEEKRKVLWIEQFPNAKVLTSAKIVDETLAKAKEAGLNCAVLDVKGPEGYASYRKNNLSKTPYFTATINPNKKVEDDGFDLLQAVVDASKKHGLRVYVSFNFFTEGNLTTQDFAVLKQHPEWEEIVQRPEDKGALLKVSESTIGLEAKAGKRIALAFANPSNKEVCDFQLLRLQEVLENYAIDGVVLDRTRYDNHYADFSEVSRLAFEQYLEKKGKKLNAFPQDAFAIDKDGKMIEGQHYLDWITFRSTEIANFSRSVRKAIDTFNTKAQKRVELAAYVGSWYEVYYQNGVNWASRNFKYDARLKFPETRVYSAEYSEASYTDVLDFLMIGTYYKTAKEIEKYVTLGNILTNGELPLIASISLPDLKDDVKQTVFESAVETSSGLMLFDLCYIGEWAKFIEQMKNVKNK